MKKSRDQDRETVSDVLDAKIGKLQQKREWKYFFIECIVVVAVVYAVMHFVVGLAIVSGSSMEPELSDGDLVLFYRLDESYQCGDIVIIRMDGDFEYIKRVVAEAGDVVDLTDEGVLTVNGEAETSMTYGSTYATTQNVSFPYTVPQGCYFVLGDNRENSRDSRSFGAVSEEDIVGRAFAHLGIL